MKLKQLLKTADISGAQLARRVGVTTSAVCSWCTGKTAPSYNKLPDIAKALGVSIEKVVMCFVQVDVGKK